MLSLIPDSLKQALVDGLVNFLASQADHITDGALGTRLRNLSSDGALRRAMETALRRAAVRFEREYVATDPELVAEIRAAPEFWQQPQVHKAMSELITRPGAWSADERERIVHHFVAVLPQQPDRAGRSGSDRIAGLCCRRDLGHPSRQSNPRGIRLTDATPLRRSYATPGGSG